MQSNYEEKKCDICRGRDIQGGCPKCLKYNNLRNNTFIDACQPQNEVKELAKDFTEGLEKEIEELNQEYLKAFGSEFKLWHEYGWWLQKVNNLVHNLKNPHDNP